MGCRSDVVMQNSKSNSTYLVMCFITVIILMEITHTHNVKKSKLHSRGNEQQTKFVE